MNSGSLNALLNGSKINHKSKEACFHHTIKKRKKEKERNEIEFRTPSEYKTENSEKKSKILYTPTPPHNSDFQLPFY